MSTAQALVAAPRADRHPGCGRGLEAHAGRTRQWHSAHRTATAEVVARLNVMPGLAVLAGDWDPAGTVITAAPLESYAGGEEVFAYLDRFPAGDADHPFRGLWIGLASFPTPTGGLESGSAAAFHRWMLQRGDDGCWALTMLLLDCDPDEAWTETRDLVETLLDGPAAQLQTGPLARITRIPPRAEHAARVEQAITAIRAGEVYQVNVCDRFELALLAPVPQVWAALQAVLAPRRGALWQLPLGGTIISASPESLVARDGGAVTTSPIKGTRPMTAYDDRDVLAASAKDRAENTMIVDLMRNDLSKVSLVDGVTVSKLCEVEAHAGVWHLVSQVDASLPEGTRNADLAASLFPAGSIAGAPKVRAVELIGELEDGPRGAYTGSLLYATGPRHLEMSVLIRTLQVADRGVAVLGVGGGVTADSVPSDEAEELYVKAAPLLAALGSSLPDAPQPAGCRGASAGLLETMRVDGGRVPLLAEHLARLRRSHHRLYRCPLPAADERALRASLEALPDRARLRWLVGGESPAAHELTELEPWVPLADQPGRDAVLRPAPAGGLGGDKWRDRTAADRLEADAGDAIVVLTDEAGLLLEGTRHCLLAIVDERLWLPPLDGRILPSVLRTAVLDAAVDLGVPVVIAPLSRATLSTASACYVGNALRLLEWVCSLEATRWQGPEEIGRRLEASVRARYFRAGRSPDR